jgi:hypothetical protein
VCYTSNYLRVASEALTGEAIVLSVYHIVRELGSLVAALGGTDEEHLITHQSLQS